MNKSERRIKVANLLVEEELSSKEIAKKLGAAINKVSPIIVELKKQGKIHSITPRKFVWGIRHENGQDEFSIKKHEWVELEKYELKVFYKNAYTFSGYTENGEWYYENHSLIEFHRDNKELISIDVIWLDKEKGEENEIQTEASTGEEIFRIILKYTVISTNAIKLKIRYERKEIKLTETERKAIKEQEAEVKKQISNWMEKNFK
jgi:hypothetical protein